MKKKFSKEKNKKNCLVEICQKQNLTFGDSITNNKELSENLFILEKYRGKIL